MKQYGLNGSYYNEEMSSVKGLDLLPRYIYMSYSTGIIGSCLADLVTDPSMQV